MLYCDGKKREGCVKLKTLIISDLDGTLLTAKERISEYSLEHLNSMIDERGLCFTYATARSLNSATKACWGLRQNLPVILYNGALIMEPSTQKKLYNNHFNKGQLAYLKELFTRFDVWPLAYSFSGDKEYVSWIEGKETDGVKRYLERRRGDARLHPIQRREELRDDDIFYFTCIGKKEDLDGLHELVEQSLDIRCIYEQEMYRTDYWCEIMPVGTSKGAAAKKLKEILGAERVICFGDGNNDRSLFSMADESYAVRNATQELKEMASGVIGFSEEDSVCKFLAEHISEYT